MWLSACLFQHARTGRPHLRVHKMTHLSYKGRELGGLFGTSKRLHNVILSLLCTHLHRRGGDTTCAHSTASRSVLTLRTLSMCRPTVHTGALRTPLPPPSLWKASWTLGPLKGEGGREEAISGPSRVLFTPQLPLPPLPPPAPTLPSCTLSSVSAPLADAHAVQASALTCNAVHGNRDERTGRWL